MTRGVKLPPDKLREAIRDVPVPQHYAAIQDAVLKNVVEWLDKRKRNTYLVLEEPCEWVSFSLEDWQAFCKEAGLKE